MVLYLVNADQQIVGKGASQESCPSNLALIESELNHPIQAVYFKNGTIHLKPSQPSPSHYWDYVTQSWVEPPTIITPNLNWNGLQASLRGSDFFNKAWMAAGECTRCNRNLMQIQMALSSTHNLQDFVFAFNSMRSDITALAQAGTVPDFLDFTQSELDTLGALLSDANFDLELFNLAEAT